MIKLKTSCTKQTSFEAVTLFISTADFICGIYLLFMLSASTHYSGVYFANELFWRSSAFCHLAANILSIFACFAPVVKCFSTMSKYLVIKYPFESKYKRVKRAYYHCVSFLTLSTSISVLVWCVHYFWEKLNTLETPLCSLIGGVSKSLHIQIFTSLVSSYFVASCFVVTSTNIFLFCEYRESKQASHAVNSNKKEGRALVAQISVHSVSHFLGWICPAVVFFLSLVLVEYPFDMFKWTLIAAVPINSIVNPAVFLVMIITHKCHAHSKGGSRGVATLQKQ